MGEPEVQPNFLKDLAAKLKAQGLPMLEKDVEALWKVLSDHVKTFKYPNPLLGAIVPVAMASLDDMAKEQIDKIDGVQG